MLRTDELVVAGAGPAEGAGLAARQALPRFTPQELWQVLGRQAALYTGMASSSVPVETAAELMEAVLFCVGVAFEAAGGADETPAPQPLAQWLLAGQRILTRRHGQGLLLQQAAQAACLPLENPVYRGALEETRRFFTWYDIRFMAHQVPCMIDYPLALPVPEGLKGVDYISEYLRRRLWEDGLCGRFPTREVRAALGRHAAAWRQLPLNLFEPVLAAALGGMLAGRARPVLALPAGETAALRATLAGQSQKALEKKLEKAAGRLCTTLRLWGSAQRAYYRQCAMALAPHILAADEAGLARLFLLAD